MKATWRTLLFLLILISIGLFASIGKGPDERALLIEQKTVSEGSMNTPPASDSPNYQVLERAKDGISIWIGKTEETIRNNYGEPDRIDETEYHYQWWVYNKDIRNHFQFAIADGRVVSALAAGENAAVLPFQMGQSINEMYTIAPIEGNVEFEWQDGHYRFELTEQEFYTRPLVALGEIYAQLYFDRFNGQLSMIRYMDRQTLVFQKPYELSYSGILDEPETPSEEEWKAIERGKELSILDLTNVIRNQFNLSVLKEDDALSKVSRKHSQDMYENNYFSHVSPDKKDLADRLKKGDVPYFRAGENIAAEYVDAAAVMEGWMNSQDHRNELLNPDFRLIGVGVYRGYYTQNFVEPISAKNTQN